MIKEHSHNEVISSIRLTLQDIEDCLDENPHVCPPIVEQTLDKIKKSLQFLDNELQKENEI